MRTPPLGEMNIDAQRGTGYLSPQAINGVPVLMVKRAAAPENEKGPGSEAGPFLYFEG